MTTQAGQQLITIKILQNISRSKGNQTIKFGQLLKYNIIFKIYEKYSWTSFFLIYVNDLPNGLKSECKLFADDTSLFSVVHEVSTSASDINNDWVLISD